MVGTLSLMVGILVLAILMNGVAANGRSSSFSPAISASSSGRCPVGDLPSQPAYDPSNHYLYVPNQVSHNVSILTANCIEIANVTLGKGNDPIAAVFNPSNNDVYVSGGNHHKIYVIHNTALVHTISSSLIDSPWGMVYDPAVQSVIVTDYADASVTAIYGMVPFDVTPVGYDPVAVAYDPYENQLLVTNSFSNNVTIIGASSLDVIGSIPVGADPQQVAFDPQDSMDYVANVNSNNVSVIFLDTVVSTISLSVGPDGVAFDQKNLLETIAQLL